MAACRLWRGTMSTLEQTIRACGMRGINPRTMILGALFALMAFLSLRVFVLLTKVEPNGFDYCGFWAGARVAMQHPVRLYDFAYVTARQTWLIGPVAMHPFVYPPSSVLFFAPFAWLSYWPAYGLWLALTAALFLMASLRIGATWLVLLLPPVACVAQDGQITFLIAALIAGGLSLRSRPMLAGMAFGLAGAIKPQLLVLLPLALVADRQWRTIGVAGATAGLIAAVATAIWGPGLWADWLRAMARFQRATFAMPSVVRAMITPYAALDLAGLRGAWAFPLIPPVLLAVWSTFRRTADVPTRMLALIGGTLLIIPYAINYELALLAPALAALAMRTQDRRWPAYAAAVLLYAAAVPVLGMGYIYCQSALVLLLALLGWARWPSLRTRPDAWAPIARPRIPTRVAAEVRRQEQHTANFT